jgi:predicted transporter
MAVVNGGLIGLDTAGALGGLLGVESLAALSLPGVGVGIVVATGLYLAGAYAYKHWAWFRQDLAQPIGHAVVDNVKELGQGAEDLGHDIASLF